MHLCCCWFLQHKAYTITDVKAGNQEHQSFLSRGQTLTSGRKKPPLRNNSWGYFRPKHMRTVMSVWEIKKKTYCWMRTPSLLTPSLLLQWAETCRRAYSLSSPCSWNNSREHPEQEAPAGPKVCGSSPAGGGRALVYRRASPPTLQSEQNESNTVVEICSH